MYTFTSSWRHLVRFMLSCLALSSGVLSSACDSTCAEERPELCSVSFLGPRSASYEESDESDNGDVATAEDTSYSLDRDGLELLGSFEQSAPSVDAYAIHADAVDEQSEVGLDAQVLIEGRVMGIGDGLTLRVQSVDAIDFETQTATSFEDARLPTDQSYVLSVVPTDAIDAPIAGKTYRLEVRAHKAR